MNKSAEKTTTQMLTDLGYTTEKAPYQGRKMILKDGIKIGDMTALDATNFLKNQRPEYFEGVN
ncbi:hypothetical protein [Acetobacterium wieringae]|uniref:hypothetical protein n=1 Tax=Acetobacterium wieringae TaxID=52694 RepID=UPI0020345562|nr:hypothetical protein [Acetobacterium wieringae]URN83997.1 hypothetical protein CHL1_003165 [Acetobacterium wieringae]URN85176.1 hypothetical protein CHL1_000807 [Acetobacterium wieringae]